MIDIVFPDQNEEEFISMAEKLGYDSMCFFYKELKPAYIKHIEHLQKGTKVRLFTASSISKKLRPDILIIKTTDPRQWLEGRKADLVFGMESNKDKDTITQKRSGLNHVLCSIAKQKDKIIGFDFGAILLAKGRRRSVLLGRTMQNIKLCRKYKVETAIASFAHEPLRMRNPVDLRAFFSMLGMGDKETKESLSSAEKSIMLNTRKKNKEYISEGVERI
jgi:hypothetical protein